MPKSSIGKSVYVTALGLQEAQSELRYLKSEKRNQVAERIQIARETGNIDESADYDAAMEEQALLENRIGYLEKILNDAKVIKKQAQSDIVVIGSTVKVEMGGELDEFTIVGKIEANPAQKRISNESPIGSALLGAKKGEEVEVATPIVRYKCKILEIK